MSRYRSLIQNDSSPTDAFRAFLGAIQVPGDTLVDIDRELQARFFPKTVAGGNVERWKLPPVDVGGCSREDFQRHLAAIGYGDATKPPRQRYVYGTVPGASVVRELGRMNDLIGAWKEGVRWEESVLFAGERPLDAKLENVDAVLKALVIHEADDAYFRAKFEEFPKTEWGMARFCWSALRDMGQIPRDLFETKTTFVNAPMKPGKTPDAPLQRPQTEDPLHEWLKESPEPGSMLVSCGTPYATSMSVAFESVLGPKDFGEIDFFGHGTPEIDFDGSKKPGTLGIEVIMREIAGAVHRYGEWRRLL